MPTPEELAVDLHDLWFAEKALDEMAGAQTSAAATLSGASAKAALARPSGIGVGGSHGIYDTWASVRDQITTVLTTNGTNLADSAAAMRLCIVDFTDTETDVRRELEKRKQEIPYE